MNNHKHLQSSKYLVGIMSGTSCDGIDVAIVDIHSHKLVHFSEHPMPAELRESCLRIAKPGFDEIDQLGTLDRALGMAFAQAVVTALKEKNIPTQQVLAIGSHGQTVRHRPQGISGGHPFTLQIGCAATLAEQTGITVISDFRSRDIAAGGEGAPLVPFAHQTLFANHDDTIAILNIGGIANITILNTDGSVQGFDTGPGNMVMDALMLQLSDGRHAYDKNGNLASAGETCQTLLNTLLQHPFIHQRPPKSTGREAFGKDIVDRLLAWPDISDADRMATACAFTAQSIIAQLIFLKELPKRWFVCGGGVFNAQLMQILSHALAPAEVKSTQQDGIPPEAVEAVSFALLAQQTLLGRNNTLAEVTGAQHAVCGGQITPSNNWQQVSQWIYENNR